MQKQKQYENLLKDAQALVDHSLGYISNMANLAALIHHAFDHHWTGFYIVKGDFLELGPFQGPVACSRIALGNGVCGTAWEKAKTQIVEDVNEFPGHIACSPLSKSEIVVPHFRNHQVFSVLDIDSADYGTFNRIDQKYLEQIINLL